METVTFANIIAILIAILGRLFSHPKRGLLIAIIFLTIFYGVRTDYGNDIPAYMKEFDYIASLKNYIDYDGRLEIGWVFINYLFKNLGWQYFIFFITIIQFGTVYWLIRKYVQPEYIWFILFLYVFDSNMLLTELSMIRQMTAMCICCWSLPFIINKKIIYSAIFILLAFTMHTSAIIMLLLIPIPFITKINYKYLLIGFLITYAFFAISERVVGDIVGYMLDRETFEQYSVYLKDEKISGTGLGILFQVFTISWMICNYRLQPNTLLFIISCAIGCSIIPFSNEVPLVGRIIFYFSFIGLPAYQLLLKPKNNLLSLGIICMLFYITIRGYFGFFESPVWHDHFAVYHTIFD